MPLSLGPETLRPHRIVWDIDLVEDHEHAETYRSKLLKQGFKESSWDLKRGEGVFTPPAMPENHGLMRILSENGDDRLVWDRSKKDEVKDAYNKFSELLGKGHVAYNILQSGQRGHKIDTFDPLAEEILMCPTTKPG